MVLLWGEDGIMIYNDSYVVYAGERHPQLLGINVSEGWPDIMELNPSLMQQGLAGMALTYKDSAIMLEGDSRSEVVSVDLNCSPALDESGKPFGVLIIMIEKTKKTLTYQKRKEAAEYKEAARALKESEGRFRLLVSSTSDVVYRMNPDWSEMQQIEGRGFTSDTGEPTTNWAEKYIYPDDQEYVLSVISESIRKKIIFQLEHRVLQADGSVGWTFSRAIPIFDKDGEIEEWFGAATDVTERKIAEEALKESEERFRVVSENATTGLFMIDEHFNCTFMNPAAERITGFTFAEVSSQKKPLYEILQHTKPDGSRSSNNEWLMDDSKLKQSKVSGDYVFIRPDGTSYPVTYMASPIVKNDVSIGTIIEVRDITEQKQAEHEQRELISITEQRNALLNINRTKDEFIGMASHQLRTPATAVKQYLGLLIDGFCGLLSVEQKKFAEIAYNSNERELVTINELLKTAQIDSLEYDVDADPCDISLIVARSIANTKYAFNMRKQTVEFTKPDTPVVVNVDDHEMILIFINLLENASKYSFPDSTIQVKIKDNIKYVEVSFKDTGVGISEENQERIFDKFTRIDNELSDTVTGTGLGLYWVRQIVQKHKGTVTLQSAIGKGSTFFVRIPKWIKLF